MFAIGEGSQSGVLHALFLFSSLMLVIHLLNMLIAIMGNTFAERSSVAEQIMIRDHLTFIVDNFHLIPYVFTNKTGVKYLIAAFHAKESEENENEEQIQQLVTNSREMITNAQENQNNILKKLKELSEANV